MKKIFAVFFLSIFSLSLLALRSGHPSLDDAPHGGDAVSSIDFVDSCGRRVILPQKITKIASSGVVATMFLASVAPEYMCNISTPLTDDMRRYLPQNIWNLPVTGQLYGTKAMFNAEKILSTGAQVMIDIGDCKEDISENLDAMQKQLGIPCIFIEADLKHMAQAFRTLGELLYGKEARGEELARFADATLLMAQRNAEKIHDRKTVMYSSTPDGLGTNASGSSHAQAIESVGAVNAVVLPHVNPAGGGSVVNLEQVYNFNPDVILVSDEGCYDMISSDRSWGMLRAVCDGSFYKIPCKPYNWMGNPPALNMILGIWWLGNLLYPEHYDYDIDVVVKDFYRLFWGCELEDDEVKELLVNSRNERNKR